MISQILWGDGIGRALVASLLKSSKLRKRPELIREVLIQFPLSRAAMEELPFFLPITTPYFEQVKAAQ